MVSFDDSYIYWREKEHAGTKRRVLAVNEARTSSLFAYFRIGFPVQTLRKELNLIVILSVIVSVNTTGSFNSLRCLYIANMAATSTRLHEFFVSDSTVTEYVRETSIT